MEIVTISGVVVAQRPYGDASKILDIITKEYGLISVISKGSKRLKSDLRILSQVFAYANFEISYKENKLSTLISGDIINNFYNVRKSIYNISYFSYICDLTKQVIRQSSSKMIYDDFISALLKIEEGFDAMVIVNILELKYTNYLGVCPKFDGCVICGSKNVVTLSASKGGYVCKNHLENDYVVSEKTIKIIKLLKYVDISKISKLDLSSKVKEEINNFIDEYYEKYTGLYLKSKKFLGDLVKS